MKSSLLLVLGFVALLALTTAANAAIYVPDDCPTIQQAVNDASLGDEIVVRDGTYYENIIVAKSYLTIRSENGSANCFIKANDSAAHTIYLRAANHVNIQGFTIFGGVNAVVIRLYGANFCEIKNNVVSGPGFVGIQLYQSNSNTISENAFSDYEQHGIAIQESCDNKINNNTVSDTELCGIFMDNSSDNEIRDNTVSDTGTWSAIQLSSSDSNEVFFNTISNAGSTAIYLSSSSNNAVCHNSISYAQGNGISLAYSSNDNIIYGNTISNTNFKGIRLHNSSENVVSMNTISNNDGSGIYLINIAVGDNTIRNNNISNNDEHGICLISANQNRIWHNTILDNALNGIRLENSGGNSVQCNWLQNNSCGIYLYGIKTTEISFNSIVANGVYNVTTGGYEWQLYNDQDADVLAEVNYWGTDDASVIEASIKDDDEDPSLGAVDFVPALALPAPCAPGPTPTPTPTPTPVPEFTSVALIAAFIMALLVLLRRR